MNHTPYVYGFVADQYIEYSATSHPDHAIACGVHQEGYGNPFDEMGNISHGHFTVREKLNNLHWLTSEQSPDIGWLDEQLDLDTEGSADRTHPECELGVSGSVSVLDPNQGGLLDLHDRDLLAADADTSLIGLTKIDRYLHGDLNNDGLNNHTDSLLFKQLFAGANGPSVLSRLTRVPETSSWVTVLAGVVLLSTSSRGRGPVPL